MKMKKTSILVLTLLAIFAFASGKSASAAETTLKPNVVYAEDFEGYAVDANHDEVYQAKGLFWFDSSMISAKVVDRDGDKQIKYTIENFNGTYSTLGVIGSGAIGNLVKLVDGQKYHFSMYVDTTNVAAGSTLWIEYQETNWVGAKIIDGVAYACDPANVFNLSYSNNILEFDFIGFGFGEDLKKGYVKLTGQNMEVYDVVYMDDLAITEVVEASVLSMDFEKSTVGADAHATSNIWLALGQTLKFGEADGNKFLQFGNTSEGQAWPAFYFNGLPVSSGVEYKLEFDILEGNFERMYVCYPESQAEEIEYGRNELIGKGDNTPSLGETTFDGNHLSLIFTPSTDKGQHWAQVKLVFYHNNSTLDVKIDNVKITPTVSPVAAKSISANVTEKQLCVGKDVDLSDLEVTLTRNNDLSRVLASDEYTIDSSLVNKDAVGEYPVTIKAVDELGNEVSTIVTVKYVAHTEVDDKAVEATCTESGKTAGKHCSVCDEVTVPQTEVPATGHADEDGNHKCDACEADLPHDEPTEEPKQGCGGSVIASIFGALALTASVVVLRKKREE
jgi:hypothetical protein